MNGRKARALRQAIRREKPQLTPRAMVSLQKAKAKEHPGTEVFLINDPLSQRAIYRKRKKAAAP